MSKVETVGGQLEVAHTTDTHKVIVNLPNLHPDENGLAHMVFSPRQARSFANLLIGHAECAEVHALGHALRNRRDDSHETVVIEVGGIAWQAKVLPQACPKTKTRPRDRILPSH